MHLVSSEGLALYFLIENHYLGSLHLTEAALCSLSTLQLNRMPTPEQFAARLCSLGRTVLPSGTLIASNPRWTMVAKHYTYLFFVLALLLWSPGAMGQSPQAGDCNACVCAITGSNFDGIIPDAVVFGPQPPFNMLAGRTYRRFNATAGHVYRISTCNATNASDGLPVTDDLVMHIRGSTTPYPPMLGFCDNDGCGETNGRAAVTFIAPANDTYRAYIYRGGACPPEGATIAAINGITVEWLGPVPVPANDEPCGAVDLGPLSGSCSSPVAGTTIGATETTSSGLSNPGLSPSSGCGSAFQWGGPGGDVWYRVEVPPTGLIGVETSETSLCAGVLGIYRADACSGTFNWVTGTTTGLCSLDGLYGPQQAPGIVFDAFEYGMSAGDMVYIRYWERLRNEEGEFTICAYAPQRPVNNAPCGAIAITPADPCTPATYSTAFSSPALTGITVPALSGACGNPGAFPINDLWYVVTVPATNNFTVTLSAGTLDDMAMAWYRLSTGNLCTPPASLTLISCNDNASGTNLMPRINSSAVTITPALTAGEQIYVRVWNKKALQSNYWGTFSICVTPNDPPPNNLPCGAIALEVNYDCVLTPTTNENATLTGAPAPAPPFLPAGSTLGASSCAGSVVHDVWYTVQVPLDLPIGQSLVFDTERYTDNITPRMTVYRPAGDCGSTLGLTQVAPNASSCNAGGSSYTPGFMPRVTLSVPQIVPGELLYIRITGGNSTQGNFGICVQRTDPQSCGGTVYDTGGPAGSYANNTNWQQIYCPTKPGDVVTLDFLQFATEANYDFLYIYNGDTTSAPLLGVWSGNSSPGVVSATVSASNPSGCLTVRFTSDFMVVAPGFAFKLSCASYIPQPPAVGDCGLQVYDPGGPGGNYANNIGSNGNPPFQQTYCPNTPGEVVTLTFNSFNTETNWDKLWIFDGPNTSSPMISSGNGVGFGPNTFGPGAYWGSGSIGPFTATISASNPNGCLTVYFQTDAGVTYSGWNALVTCAEPGAVVPGGGTPAIGGAPGQTTTACGSFFLDDGGSGVYAHYGDWTRTICPAVAGELVQVTFLSFNVESSGATSCWDALYVYDGPTVASPLINSGKTSSIWTPPNPYGPGGHCGTEVPGPFTSTHSSGCLTFSFFTDNSVTYSGWNARVDCFEKPTNDNPCPAVNATPLPVSTACVPVTSSNMGATPTTGIPSPGCGNYQGSDVWFRFTAPANGRVFIESFAGTLTDGAMALYSAASCPGPFTLIQCNDDGGVGSMPRIDRLCNPLVPGQQYWLRFWGVSGTQGDFSLCVRTRDDATAISDCLGAFTLCSDEPFSGSNLGVGCSNDLTAANWGCLAGGERQGNWYAFSVQNPGTLGMTITPSAGMDVDWGIWGPYTPGTLPNSVAGTCTPTMAPLRCSNASLYYTMAANSGSNTTGMGNANLALNTPRYANTAPAINDGPLPPAIDGWIPGINVAAGQVYLLFVDDHHLNGGSYAIDWVTTPTTVGTDVMNCTVLPVELLSFDAKARMEHVDVMWSTSTERNSSHFIVQRSADAEHFLDIGRVEAAGESVGTIDYGFVDTDPLPGISYYRLQQVDLDGGGKYSDLVPVAFGPGQRGIELYPNPAVERVWVLFDAITEGEVRWQITDASGRHADHGYFGGTKGRNGHSIELNTLEPGTYLIQLFDENSGPIGQARFVKQH